MAHALNYEASVEFGERSPFRVNADPNKPPGDRFKDYIPNPRAPQGKVTPPTRSGYRKPLIRGTDFISNAETTKSLVQEQTNINRLAKEMYTAQSHKRAMYKEARQLVDASTAEEIANPAPELEKALRIIKRPPPLSKTEVIEAATKQFYGAAQ